MTKIAKQSSHTRGTWVERVQNLNGWRSIGVAGMRQAVATAWVSNDVSEINDDQCEANARLIAASPDLLAALQDVVDSFHDHPDRDETSLALARTAIAKATGNITVKS